MSTKEVRSAAQEPSCKRLMVDKGNYYRSRGKEIYPSWYFGQKKRFDAPTRSPLSCVVIPRWRWLPRLATGSKYPKYKVPPFPLQRTYSVKDKRSTRSMGWEPLQLCFWTHDVVEVDDYFDDEREGEKREIRAKRNIGNACHHSLCFGDKRESDLQPLIWLQREFLIRGFSSTKILQLSCRYPNMRRIKRAQKMPNPNLDISQLSTIVNSIPGRYQKSFIHLYD